MSDEAKRKPPAERPTPRALRLDTPGLRPDMPRVMPRRAEQLTITNEAELETARLRSLTSGEDGTPKPAVSEQRSGDLDWEIPSDVLDLADGPPAAETSDTAREMRDRFSLGDYSGALIVAEAILEAEPMHTEAKKYADNCRHVLGQMYAARLGPLDRAPRLAVAREQLRWLNLDHRAGFVLSHVDGVSSLEQILDVSGMPPLDALRILFELLQQRVIAF